MSEINYSSTKSSKITLNYFITSSIIFTGFTLCSVIENAFFKFSTAPFTFASSFVCKYAKGSPTFICSPLFLFITIPANLSISSSFLALPAPTYTDILPTISASILSTIPFSI